MPKFIAHISHTQVHKLVVFEVPDEHLEGAKDYKEVVNKAGWWYTHKIDHINSTGPYEWSIFPYDFIDDILIDNDFMDMSDEEPPAREEPISKEWIEGQQAGRNNEAKSNNPYKPDSNEYAEWQWGWESGNRVKQEARKDLLDMLSHHSKKESNKTKINISQEQWREGQADIMIDGEIHHFEFIMDNTIPYWLDTTTGEAHHLTEFNIFDLPEPPEDEGRGDITF